MVSGYNSILGVRSDLPSLIIVDIDLISGLCST